MRKRRKRHRRNWGEFLGSLFGAFIEGFLDIWD
ncbi:hypothetical protein JOEDIRT_81 [Mycobacterium phage JoeDirt]|uniref:Uncharacterized protein n=1 Tax=Mycobacterium phage JoeDirt TaxID=2920882 RepID=G1BQL0_9CAUD|nr:hypothetical protein FGG55_gp081 [Mycobacterium phage JoeDirt]AEK07169.1 hypothetical protein JOEDIRT_81 [Mycobacterium phage JoeDirt]QWT30650.1 hypothetical protein SEA_ROSE5_81 [Mycobacterium phage Rose5]